MYVVFKGNMQADCGGVLRDYNGVLCGGVSNNIGVDNIDIEKLQGIKKGLNVTYERSHKKGELQIDNKEFFYKINKNAYKMNTGKISLQPIRNIMDCD